MKRLIGIVPSVICVSTFVVAGICAAQSTPPPASGPVVIGEAAGAPAAPAPVVSAAPANPVPFKPPSHDDPPSPDTGPVKAPESSAPAPLPGLAKAPATAPKATAAAALPTKPGPDKTNPKSAPYVIGPLDVLEIKVWNAPNLSGIVDVGPDGMISLALLGEIRADGLTQQELMKVIRGKLGESYFTDPPEVNVQVVRNNSKKYYMYGEVNRPGEFPLSAPTTVLEAFANCGGFREFANQKKIYILRGDKKLPFNFKDVSNGKHMEQNIYLENGDKIFVKD